MSRCCPFFVFPRREECASPSRSGGIIDEQRRKGEKAAQPGWRESFGLSGCVARSSQVAVDMLVGRALPSQPKPLPRRRGRVFQQAPRRGALFPQELPSPATAQENRAALGSVL